MAGSFSRFLALVGRSRTATGVVLAALASTPVPLASAAPAPQLAPQLAEEPQRRRPLDRWLLFSLPALRIAPQAGHGSHSSHASHASGSSGHSSHYSGSHVSHSSHYSGTTTPGSSGTTTSPPYTPYPTTSRTSPTTTTQPAVEAPATSESTLLLRISAWDANLGRLVGRDDEGVSRQVHIVDATVVHQGDTIHAAAEWRGPKTNAFQMPLPIDGSVLVGWRTTESGVFLASSLYLVAP